MFGNPFPVSGLGIRLLKLPFLTVLCSLVAVAVVRPADLQVGFGDFQPNSNGVPPTGAALFRLVNPQGVLVSEAGAAAARLLREGRIFVQQSASWNTSLALANPLDRKVTLRLVLRNAQGVEIARIERTELEPHEHRAKLVNELFTGLPTEFLGSLTFQGVTAEDRIAAVTLRQTANRHGEPLYSTLPVAEIDGDGLSGPDDQSQLVFPQVGAGQGLSTQLILISRSPAMSRGRIRFTDSDGSPLVVLSSSGAGSDFSFELPAAGVYFSEFTNPPGVVLAVGYAKVEMTEGVLPAGTAIFRFQDGGKSISEAGVGAMPMTRKARIFVDSDKTSTGFAIANPGASNISITYRLLDANGAQIQQTNRVLPAHCHIAKFAHEIFDLPDRFVGLIEMEGNSAFVPISLKLTSNSRRESILTTLPVADLLDSSSTTRLVFPQMGFGGSVVGPFSTRLIFIAGDLGAVTSGNLSFWTGTGDPWPCREIPSAFYYAVAPGGAGDLHFESEPPPLMIERESRTKVLIGPDGGTLEVENERGDTIALEIPPRAFEESRYITMTALRSPPTDIFGYNIFPGVVIEPDGLVLHRPARLQVLLKDPLPHPELSGLFWVVSGTQVRGIAGQRSSDQLIGGEVYHFSPYTGAQLTLSEAVYWAEVLAGMDPARRSDLPLPPLDGPLADFMVTWTDVTSLLQLDQMFQTLTGDSRYRELAESLLEEGILAFLSKPAPKNRCSLYHEYLSRLSDLAAPLLTDPGVNQLLAERVADVDEECITSIAGNWQIESISPEEICRAPALEFTGEYGEEGSSINVTINQTGSSLSASSVDYPEYGVLHGRLQATGDEAVPYSLDLSIEGADSPDCLAFFAGEEDDFGYPVCAGQPGCRPISCYETYLASAEVSWNGLALSGMAVWTFTATVRVPDPDGGYKRVTYSCLGAAG